MTGRIVGQMALSPERRPLLTIELTGNFSTFINKQLDRLQGKVLDITLVQHRERRSLDANAYFWELLGKLAETLDTDRDGLYLAYVKQAGVAKDFTLLPKDVDTFCAAWHRLGKGWPTELVDYDGDSKMIVRAYYGSSSYNTKQMSRLIDNLVQDAQALGITTESPEKIEELNKLGFDITML